MYVPGFVPNKPEELPGFLGREFAEVSRSMQEAQPALLIGTMYAAPKKVMDGMIVLADGTNWNPGSGAGYYGYRAGAWRFLG